MTKYRETFDYNHLYGNDKIPEIFFNLNLMKVNP